MKHAKRQNNVTKRHILLLSVFMVAVVTLIFTVPTASAGHRHHRHPRACSKTASAAYLACRNEVKDDYWIAQGNCYNATEDQAECFAEAKEDYKNAREECRDQLEARKDLCEELGEAPYDPEIDPDDFINPADIGGDVDPNPYFPLVTGNTWEYQGGDETTTVEVTDEIIEILGVPCVVVTDVVEEDGEEIEVTQDWFAQDEEGNVWYMGESSLGKVECDDEDDPDVCEGLVTEEGSWKAGFEYAGGASLVVQAALPGALASRPTARHLWAAGRGGDVPQLPDPPRFHSALDPPGQRRLRLCAQPHDLRHHRGQGVGL